MFVMCEIFESDVPQSLDRKECGSVSWPPRSLDLILLFSVYHWIFSLALLEKYRVSKAVYNSLYENANK